MRGLRAFIRTSSFRSTLSADAPTAARSKPRRGPEYEYTWRWFFVLTRTSRGPISSPQGAKRPDADADGGTGIVTARRTWAHSARQGTGPHTSSRGLFASANREGDRRLGCNGPPSTQGAHESSPDPYFSALGKRGQRARKRALARRKREAKREAERRKAAQMQGELIKLGLLALITDRMVPRQPNPEDLTR